MRGKASRYGRFRRIVLALGSMAFGLFILEAGVWLAHAVIGGKPRLLRADPELGWANRRDFDGSRKLEDGNVWRVSLDSHGHRRLDLDPPRGATRIVALGDSFVFGDGVSTESHFLNEVGRRLSASVVNLGVVGYSTDQELLSFLRFQGKSDVVLLGTYLTNDLAGNLSHSGGSLLRFKPKFADCADAVEPMAVQHPLLNRARHRSYLVTLALGGLHRLAPDLRMFDTPPPGSEAAGESAAWTCYERLVDRIVDEAERRGARQTVILLWSFHSSRPDPAAAPALRARFTGRNVRIIDLDRIVAERGVDPSSLYHSPTVDSGAHWNVAGHAFVAEVVVAALVE